MTTQPESCVQLLQAMVGIDTVNHHISGRAAPERPLGIYLESLAAALGLQTRRLAIDDESFNLLVTCTSNATAPWLLFESHLDTVSTEGMTIEPFAARISDGRIHGRGAADTKGTGAAMFWALRGLAGAAERPNNVAIVFTTDEEIRKTGIRTFTGRHLAELGWRPAAAVVGEPTGLRPIVAHNGIVRWRILTRGVAAHSADPSRGRSAITMMIKVIEAIETRYAPSLTASHPLTGPAQCTVNVVHGGVQVNIIPETCAIEVDRRIVPGEQPDHVVRAMEQLLDDVRRRHPGVEVEIAEARSDPALDPSGGERFAASVQATLASLGLPDEIGGVPYGTDASQFGEQGIPAIVLGPGDIAQGHTHDEWLDLAELERGVTVYGELMRRPLSA